MRIYNNNSDERFAKYFMGAIIAIVISGYVIGISGLYRNKKYQEERLKPSNLENVTQNSVER